MIIIIIIIIIIAIITIAGKPTGEEVEVVLISLNSLVGEPLGHGLGLEDPEWNEAHGNMVRGSHAIPPTH